MNCKGNRIVRTRAGRSAFMPALALALALALSGGCWSAAAAATPEEVVSYKLDVEPILQSRCVACHKPGGDGYVASGLNMTSYEGLMKGTKFGPVVNPGDPLTSNLLVLVEGRSHAKVRMPHGQRPLLKQQIEILRLWVKQGAQDN